MVKVKYLFSAGMDTYLGAVTPGGIYETTKEIADKLIRSRRYEIVEEKMREEIKEVKEKKIKNDKERID